MANITSRGKSWLLVEYRPTPGGKKQRWRCPDEATFEKFCALEQIHKQAGTPVPDPATVFGEVPRPSARRQSGGSSTPSSPVGGGSPGHAAAVPADAKPVRLMTPSLVPSVSEWIGTPTAGKPGPFFDHAKKMGGAQRRRYESLITQYGSHLATKSMSEVTLADARQMMGNMLVCDVCLARASAARRSDLLAEPHNYLSAATAPWDGSCVDEEGEDTHVSRNKRDTVVANVWLMRNVWRIAREAATLGLDSRFDALTSQPFEKVGQNVPHVPEQQTNDDLSEALSHAQLDRIRQGFPDWLRASARTGAYGLFRRSELLGLERGMIVWPTLPEHKGQAVITVSHTLVAGDGGRPVRRPWGKNKHSTREPVYLSTLATEELRSHVEEFRSTPNPEACTTCRNGIGEHSGASKTNPHRGCDFAADAPIWWDPERNERVTPRDYSLVWFERAAANAGLTVEAIGFRPTPKLLRATGATLLIDSGIPIEQVARMGRWKNPAVLRKHYHRMRESSKMLAAQALDFAARGELGLEGTGEASLEDRVRFLSRRVEVLEEQLAGRNQLLADLGIDIEAVEHADLGEPHPRRHVSPLADIDRLRELAATCRNRTEILEKLGLTSGAASRLLKVAKANNIELPKAWQRKVGTPPPRDRIQDLTAEALTGLIAEHRYVSNILRALDIQGSPLYRDQLQRRADELGVQLPSAAVRTYHDYPGLDDEKQFRAAVAAASTFADAMRLLGLDVKDGYCRTLVKQRAAHLGVELPAVTREGMRRSERANYFTDDEAIIQAVQVSVSRREVLRHLGIEYPTNDHRRLLVEHADRLGLELPPPRGKRQTAETADDEEAAA